MADGKSNWLEGLILVCKSPLIPILVVLPKPSVLGLYIIIAVSFWFYPGKRSFSFENDIFELMFVINRLESADLCLSCMKSWTCIET